MYENKTYIFKNNGENNINIFFKNKKCTLYIINVLHKILPVNIDWVSQVLHKTMLLHWPIKNNFILKYQEIK